MNVGEPSNMDTMNNIILACRVNGGSVGHLCSLLGGEGPNGSTTTTKSILDPNHGTNAQKGCFIVL